MNLNKGCIEIVYKTTPTNRFTTMNLNKGCIEIYIVVLLILHLLWDEP